MGGSIAWVGPAVAGCTVFRPSLAAHLDGALHAGFVVARYQAGEIVWQFTKAGVVNFACLMPGHYEAGMKGAIQVGRK